VVNLNAALRAHGHADARTALRITLRLTLAADDAQRLAQLLSAPPPPPPPRNTTQDSKVRAARSVTGSVTAQTQRAPALRRT